MARKLWALLQTTPYETDTQVIISASTNVAAHCWMYYTDHRPWKHRENILYRGQLLPRAVRFCFVAWQKKEQNEAGQTLDHSFTFTDWLYCHTRWFTYR